MTYKQLNRDQRLIINHELHLGTTKAEIARMIGVHRSTLTREPKRNTATDLPYTVDIAEYHAQKRRIDANALLCKIIIGSPFELFMMQKLRERWSPDEIAKRWNKEQKTSHVCPQTIYTWITRHPEFRQYLLLGRKRRRKQKYKKIVIANKRMINTRPPSVENRKTLGRRHYCQQVQEAGHLYSCRTEIRISYWRENGGPNSENDGPRHHNTVQKALPETSQKNMHR
jgi:IS30 family transposase